MEINLPKTEHTQQCLFQLNNEAGEKIRWTIKIYTEFPPVEGQGGEQRQKYTIKIVMDWKFMNCKYYMLMILIYFWPEWTKTCLSMSVKY